MITLILNMSKKQEEDAEGFMSWHPSYIHGGLELMLLQDFDHARNL